MIGVALLPVLMFQSTRLHEARPALQGGSSSCPGCFNPRACMRRDEMPAPLLTQSPPFQSTRLHEARRVESGKGIIPELFQSTRLHEARPEIARNNQPSNGVSIHAPA